MMHHAEGANTMPRRDRTVERQATLYTRGALPRPAMAQRNAVVEELDALVADGALSAVDVVNWAKRVPVDAKGTREHVLVEAFREWAEGEGVSLAPCFETRECYGVRSGEIRTELVLPVLCLTVFEDGELVEVAPRETRDGVVTVGESIAGLQDENAKTDETRMQEPVVPSAE